MGITLTTQQIAEMTANIAKGVKRYKGSDGREVELDISTQLKALADPTVIDPDPGPEDGGTGFGAKRCTFARFARE